MAVNHQNVLQAHSRLDTASIALLGKGESAREILNFVSSACNVDESFVEDVYPCTPSQIAAMSQPETESCILRATMELCPTVCIESFRYAWEQVVDELAVLRTRIVYHSKFGYVQVLIRQVIDWNPRDMSEQSIGGFGQVLARYAMVEREGQHPKFIWAIHQAIFDHRFAKLTLERVLSVLQGLDRPQLYPFKAYVDHILAQDESAAREYWASHLNIYSLTARGQAAPKSAAMKPALGQSEISVRKRTCSLGPVISTGDLEQFIYAACAIVTSPTTEYADAIFGTVETGPVPSNLAGPSATIVPNRVTVDRRMRIAEFLDRTRTERRRRMLLKQISLNQISDINSRTSEACRFDTLLLAEPLENAWEADTPMGTWASTPVYGVKQGYKMTLHAVYTDGKVDLEAHYDNARTTTTEVENTMDRLSAVIQQLACAGEDQTIEELDLLLPEDLNRLWAWNSVVPAAVERCVHDLVQEHATARPSAAAVCAWDGDLTYGELDDLSSRLACDLVELGVGPEVLVPLFFEKSRWTVVAMLAVLKAGGAFVPLDPSQGADRRERVIAQADARTVLTSMGNAELLTKPGRVVVTVGSDSIRGARSEATAAWLGKVGPSNTATVLFTSGSTGQPKGVVIEHRTLASSCLYHGSRIGFDENSRVLQFAAYTFDAAMMEILTTLIYGGCICVPSDRDRLDDVVQVANDMEVTIVVLTPSLARSLDADRLACTGTLIMGGEAITEEDFEQWSRFSSIVEVYGPAETTICCSLKIIRQGEPIVSGIGRAIGCALWVVSPEDEGRLVSIGSVGELLVEGPIVSRGYVKDAEKTAAAFIEDPPWLVRGAPGRPGRRGRLYKTGDLVRYNEDGSLAFVGRKDSQVKIRGQRVELGEVEHQVLVCVKGAQQVAAEVITPTGEGASTLLAVFMVLGEASDDETAARVTSIPVEEEDALAERLPAYMVPAVYISVTELPRNTSGKTDRRRLRGIGAGFTAQELAELRSGPRSVKAAPSTDGERALQRIWARVLNIDADTIGVDDSFFSLGGDSIAAIKLVSQARYDGIALSVADVFQHPRLASLSQAASLVVDAVLDDLRPFSLLFAGADGMDQAHAQKRLAASCGMSSECIQDAYPCTPLQEGLLALTHKSAGAYTMQSVEELADSIDMSRFRNVWEAAARRLPILRTRVVQDERFGLLQVVVDEEIRWHEAVNLDAYLEQDRAEPMELGRPLARYAIVADEVSGGSLFVWTLHHTLYDGQITGRVRELVRCLYEGTGLEPAFKDFKYFVRFLGQARSEAAAEYWRSTLAGHKSEPFPAPRLATEVPLANGVLLRHIALPPMTDPEITMASLVRAAWALTVAGCSSSRDVVFGCTVSGRHASMPGVEEVAGPTITTVPVRIQVSGSQAVRKYLRSVQEQATGMIPYEQTGLQRIREMGDDATRACDFQTLLVIQPTPSTKSAEEASHWPSRVVSELERFDTYALNVEVVVEGSGFRVKTVYDKGQLGDWAATMLVERLGSVACQLASARKEQLVAEIDVLSAKDHEQLWSWNEEVPAVVDRCVHHLVEEQAAARPSAAAVCAWDGDLTYGELDDLSSRLACDLVELRVGPEALVPLCFEKSVWTVVAMLAVLKAGGAFVPLDPSQGADRRERVIEQADAKVVLASVGKAEMMAQPGRVVVAVGPGTIGEARLDASGDRAGQASPSNTAYVLFTSGSTGQPKGVMIEHRALASSCLYHGGRIGFNESSRMLQFASHTWDASILEIFTTATHGGCVCVPSDGDRLNDIGYAAMKMYTNIAVFTPSVARMLDPSQFSTLTTMIMGGEKSTQDDIAKWSHLSKVVDGYGPTETTIFCSLNVMDDGKKNDKGIGHAVGSVLWVVAADDHGRLVPIGSVGELLVEGPILSRGYLKDAEKTAAAFIEDPPWLVRGAPGRPGRRGRLYKTGDLVRYNEDGSLAFVGRKDSQVKIRGQRVELGEVEHHVLACVKGARQVAAEVITPAGDGASAMLAAFVVMDAAHGVDSETSDVVGPAAAAVQVLSIPPAEEDAIADRLPAYMLPAVYFLTAQMPMITSGKTDRRRLRDIGAGFSAQELADLRSGPRTAKRAPSTQAERALQQIWARVLNIDAEAIGVDDSFFRLGGDSITAMQVSALARAKLGNISTGDVLRKKTISLLCSSLALSARGPGGSTPAVAETQAEVSGQPFGLSPVQKLYMGQQPDPIDCAFDQSFLLKVNGQVSLEAVTDSLAAIVSQHAMLRARYRQDGHGHWEQRVVDDVSGSFRIRHHADVLLSDAEVASAIRECRGAIDMEHGPLLAATLFGGSGAEQGLFISIHHLVVDLVSWRVILQDLEELLTTGRTSSLLSASFPAWCSMQANYAADNLEAERLNSRPIQPPLLSYWGVGAETNVLGSTATTHFELDEVATAAILGGCNDAFGTRPAELMIAALAYSFAATFDDRPSPAIFSEGHGREVWDDSIDISRTVGWFTTIFPAQPGVSPGGSLLDVVRETKDFGRGLAMNGWSYFASRFASDEGAAKHAADFPTEVAFNYAGLYQQLERAEGLFEVLPLPEGCEPPSGRGLRRFAVFDVLVEVNKGRLEVVVVYPAAIARLDGVTEWIARYEAALVELAKLLPGRAAEWTLADFPQAFGGYDELEDFREKVVPQLEIAAATDIEDIFPCTSVQEGILVAQAKDRTNYRSRLDIGIRTDSSDGKVEYERIESAWRAVMRRHSLLRAVLVRDVSRTAGRTMMLVLKNPPPNISLTRSSKETAAQWGMVEVAIVPSATASTSTSTAESPSYSDRGIQHHLSVCPLDDGTTLLRLEINHAIVDGHSVDILLRDLRAAYDGALEPIGPSYGDFSRHVEARDREKDHAFWMEYLNDVEPCLFPALGSTPQAALTDSSSADAGHFTVVVPGLDTAKIHDFCAKWEVTTASVIQTAWALVLRAYTGSTTLCFGNLSSGRDVPVKGVQDMFGPLISMLPSRVRLDVRQSAVEVVRRVHQDYVDSIPHQAHSLMETQRGLGVASTGLFNSVLSFQRDDDHDSQGEDGLLISMRGGIDPVEYDILIHAADSHQRVTVQLSVKKGFMTESLAERVCWSMSSAVDFLLINPAADIGEVSLFSDAEAQQVWIWNGTVPAGVDRCVHSLMKEQAAAYPEAPAVCAWDGKLTYGELEDLSSRLACDLVELGVGPEVLVPLCFEKSLWTVVAMMAVLKSGGAFVPLDPSQGADRRERVIAQADARIVLTSMGNAELLTKPGRVVVTVGPDSIRKQHAYDCGNQIGNVVRPENAAYVLFTSGSTGQPKGVVVEHRALTSSCMYTSRQIGVDRTSRILQCTSYAFDVSMMEIFATLVHGGCVCVPSDSDRMNDVAQVANTMVVDTAFFTPSVARELDPSQFSTLTTMIMGGEKSTQDDIAKWSRLSKVVDGYGPTETTIFCSLNVMNDGKKNDKGIGHAVGSVLWIVAAEDDGRLVPIGSVGELLVEGPILSRGYLKDAEKTAAAFIEDPPWLLRGGPGRAGRRGRLYKTGDLVRYNEDGSLAFVGRKDSQVKIRGQRVELGEVEHHVLACVKGARQVAAEVITPAGDGASAMLAAFVVLHEASDVDNKVVSGRVTSIAVEDEDMLAERLPAYMIPAVYFAVNQLPLNTSGKMDRRRLREIVAGFSAQELADLRSGPRVAKRAPSTEAERALQQIWARVLNIDAEAIGIDDSFFRLGGDSIAAMKLVALARQDRLTLSVADVFRDPRLMALSRLASPAAEAPADEPDPFSLIPVLASHEDAHDVDIRTRLSAACGLHPDNIEDAYPCTPLQEGLIALTSKLAGAYIMQNVQNLVEDIDLNRFRTAWQAATRRLPILRTRVVQDERFGLLQVVVDEQISWVGGAGLEEYLANDSAEPMELGQPLSRYALITAEEESSRTYFVWTVHHALYDGHLIGRVRELVARIYDGSGLDPVFRNFSHFVRYLEAAKSAAATEYWRSMLAGYESELFPSPKLEMEAPAAYCAVEKRIPLPPMSDSDVTIGSLMMAAWALTASTCSGTTDVVFGTTVSGRQASLPGVEEIAGPTIATVPVRINASASQTVHEYLGTVQEQLISLIPYEQTGLQRIRETSEGARKACQFETLLVVQPREEVDGAEITEPGRWWTASDAGAFTTYAFTLTVIVEDGGVTVNAVFDTGVLSKWTVSMLLETLDTAAGQLASVKQAQRLEELNTLSAKAHGQLWSWNEEVPAVVDRCVHHLVEEQAAARPDAVAVCAWDGDLTYGELDDLSSRLACDLVELRVGPEALVPLCFEKSVWTVVAMLAVLKAGGAFVPLDPSQGADRRERVIEQADAKVVLASVGKAEMMAQPGRVVVAVGPGTIGEARLEVPEGWTAQGTPATTAYVLFTSGSTGQPKGVVIEHRALASSCFYHGQRIGFSERGRVLQFTSYAFDVSMMEIFTTLLHGGCICVPSDQHRLGDVGRAASEMRVDTAFLTPSVARTIDPAGFQTLDTLILGGEKVTEGDMARWSHLGELVDGYGPTEATIFCSVNVTGKDDRLSGGIGHAVGCVLWVVQADDHTKLMPIGSVGELLVEGPILSRGYLKDAERTAAAFIEDPPWLVRGAPGRPGRRGRLYKTGDLVRYNEDGSLAFVGRKDSQVKIRGQRVELGEVEHHVLACVKGARQVAAEVITPAGDGASAMLAAFVVSGESERSDEKEVLAKVTRISAAEEDALAERLPVYMVPGVYFAIGRLPLSSAGKTDRQRLRDIGAGFSAQELADLRSGPRTAKRAPSTQAERALQQIWARVLNIDAEAIGVDDSFFRLGGDSITAMQVSALARAKLGNISTGDVLRKKTISLLCSSLALSARGPGGSTPAVAETQAEVSGQPFGLSPVQKLYMGQQPDPIDCAFDQSFLLKVNGQVSLEAVTDSLAAIVSQHAMLRARYRQDGHGHWEQRVVDDVSGSFRIRHHADVLLSDAEVASAIRECRGAIDMEHGPLLAATLFGGSGAEQGLFISIHHLVVDLVSWRVILQDLEELLTTGRTSSLLSASFPAWCSMQANYAADNLEAERLNSRPIQPPLLSYWGVGAETNVLGSTATTHFELDEVATAAILGGCNDAFGTRPAELMIAALAYSFAATFDDRPSPAIFSEGHGREVWDDSIDISRTVGWFTTIFPAQPGVSPGGSLLDVVRETKDFGRGLAMNGWSYFASRFASDEGAAKHAADFPTEVAFNYRGLYQQLERAESLFEILPLPGDCEPLSGGGLRRFAVFDVLVGVNKGRLEVSVVYPEATNHDDGIVGWIRRYKEDLEELVTLLSGRPAEWTLADFPQAFSCYHELSDFRQRVVSQLDIAEVADIEDIFPCTAVQEGMLIAQAKHAMHYRTRFDIEITAAPGEGSVIYERVEAAWRAVMRRHSLLRAVLLRVVSGTSARSLAVVLKDPAPNISPMQCTKKTLEQWGTETVNMTVSPNYSDKGIQHHLSVCLTDDGAAILRLNISHAIIDGYSVNILLRDLRAAYDSVLDPIGPSYGSFIRHVEARDRGQDHAFWMNYLNGVEPCLFPAIRSAPATGSTDGTFESGDQFTLTVPELDSAKIHDFCARWEVTTASVVQTAWALVLRAYTGFTTPCFGSLASGRDAPVRGVQDMFGPLISMLPSRVRLDMGLPASEVVQRVHQDYVDGIPHQAHSLMEIQRGLGVGITGLFNSIISFQRDVSNNTGGKDERSVSLRGAVDPVEYDILVRAADDGQRVKIQLSIKAGFITRPLAERVCGSMRSAVGFLLDNPASDIKDVMLFSDVDAQQVWTWNGTVPAGVDRCVHNLVEEQAAAHPKAAAVCAWDGNLTYGELNELSSRLARYLVELGVGPEVLVPLCFEKSLWTVVAMLAVLKAGGALVGLDPSHPAERRECIVNQTSARLVLTSSQHAANLARPGRIVVLVGPCTLSNLPKDAGDSGVVQSPASMACVIFTSGSTGQPKGVMLSHHTISTTCVENWSRIGCGPETRTLQFSSYAFDVSILEIFGSLAFGGCVCVPSDSERLSGLESSINLMSVNLAILTPTVSRFLQPSQVPSLAALVLTGEGGNDEDFARWFGVAKVMNGYGPTECTLCSLHEFSAGPSHASCIGTAVASVGWVVVPGHDAGLAPIGTVGELLVEGPVLARGYLHDPERTAASFIEDPPWLLRGAPGHPGRRGRMYRTGDLVHYNEDGSLTFIGRKDTQVKIRGMRVELGEVEYHLRACFPEVRQVAAEVIVPAGEGSTSMLAAFLVVGESLKDVVNRTLHEELDAHAVSVSSAIDKQLAQRLPGFMIPAVYFAVKELPMNTSGKTDRRQLRAIGSSISAEKLAKVKIGSYGGKKPPSTLREMALQQVWARVLNVDMDIIGVDDSFFRLGGDSITAMKLVVEAHKVGLRVSVADIFRHPQLVALSQIASPVADESPQNVGSFSLLSDRVAKRSHHGRT